MDDIFKTLPQQTCSWLKGRLKWYKYEDFWTVKKLHEGGILAQQSFNAKHSDVLLCSCPKTGTTWLKALAFAIITREKFDVSTSPLLTTLIHRCVPFLERNVEKLGDNNKNPDFPLIATHLPYTSLPKSIVTSNCKIVYIYRNAKDVLVSHYHFLRESLNLPVEDAPFEEAFEEFCQGISCYGPYWDHILGYWKASIERPNKIMFLKYEDLKSDPTNNVRLLAEFIGYPFSIDEDKACMVDNIIHLCSFEHLSNLEVNKSGKCRQPGGLENRLYFRKAKDGDWENYFTFDMKEKIDKLLEQKFSGTGLVLK